METAPSPSVAATRTPASTIRSRLRRGFGPRPCGGGRPQAAAMLAGNLSSIGDLCIPYAYRVQRTQKGMRMIEATGLRKSYGGVHVLCGVDLAVPAGGLLALLGPNGAGKTPTVRILATLTGPDAGRARVAGLDVVSDRRRLDLAAGL